MTEFTFRIKCKICDRLFSCDTLLKHSKLCKKKLDELKSDSGSETDSSSETDTGSETDTVTDKEAEVTIRTDEPKTMTIVNCRQGKRINCPAASCSVVRNSFSKSHELQ